MPSSLWVLRVVPAGNGARWDVVQPRTGRTLDAAPTQELAVERALERLAGGGLVEVVVDGFMVRRQAVLPPPVPRRRAAIDVAAALVAAGLMALLLGPLLHSSALITIIGTANAANAVRLIRQIVTIRRNHRPDPGLSGPPPTEAFLAERASLTQ